MMSTSGGSEAVAREAMLGQAMLDSGQSTVKFKFASINSVDAGIADALAGLPTMGVEAEVMAIAKGLFSYHNPEGFGSGDDAKAVTAAKDALNLALGAGKDAAGNQTGGVQEVMRHQTLLPPDVRGSDVEAAIRSAQPSDTYDFFQREELNADMWTQAGLGPSAGSLPMMGGVPLTLDQIKARDFQIRPTPEMGEYAYRLEFNGPGGGSPVRDASGGVYVFDIQKLLEAVQ
jgi:hypothetical protein